MCELRESREGERYMYLLEGVMGPDTVLGRCMERATIDTV